MADSEGIDAAQMAQRLRKAMKGWGTDEDALIDCLASLTTSQAQEVRAAFQDEFGRDLIKDIKSECGGKLEDALVALLLAREEYDAQCLYKAMKGVGTTESIITEILASRTHDEIEAIKGAYKQFYGKSLVDKVDSELGGFLSSLCIPILEGKREDADDDKIAEMVESLYKAGPAKWGTEESTFVRLIGGLSHDSCMALYDKYADEKGEALDRVIKKEMSGDLRDFLMALVTPREMYFADRLKTSMEGMGTDDAMLIRNLMYIKDNLYDAVDKVFVREHKKNIYKWVEDDCSGDYEKLLLKVCSAAKQRTK